MFSKRTKVPYPCIVCNREELDQLHSHYQASKEDFWVYRSAARNCCSRCDAKNRKFFWERYPTLSALACCEPVTTTVQIPIPASTVGVIERAVHASMIADKGSEHRAHGTFVAHLQLLECKEIYKQALITWAPKAMIDFAAEERGTKRIYRAVKAEKNDSPVIPKDEGSPSDGPPVGGDPAPSVKDESETPNSDSVEKSEEGGTPVRKNPWNRRHKGKEVKEEVEEQKIVDVSTDCVPHEEGEAVYTYGQRELKLSCDAFHANLFSPEALNEFMKKHPASIYVNENWQVATIRDLFLTRLKEAKEDIQFMLPTEVARALDISTTSHGVQVFDCDITGYTRTFADEALRIFDHPLWCLMEAYAGQQRMRRAFHKKSFKKLAKNVLGALRKDPDVKYWVLRHVIGAFDGGEMFSDTILNCLNMYHGSILISTSSFGANDLAASFEKAGIFSHLAPRHLTFTCRGMKCNFGIKNGRMAFLGH